MRIDLIFFLLLIAAVIIHLLLPEGLNPPVAVGYEDSWQEHVERQQYRQVP